MDFADTAIVGKGLGDNSLAAVGNMGSLCFLIVGFSMGLSNGFSILIAQRFGEKNFVQLRKTLAASIKLAGIITVILTAFSCIFLRNVLLLLRTDKLILSESLIYGYILFGGLEMVLRIAAISLFIGNLGFRATAFAEICAWTGALSLNAIAFIVIYARESGHRLFRFRYANYRRGYMEKREG